MDETLSPYQPTWRDRVANLLMGTDYERPSPSRRALVEGLVGSSGLGNTGMSAADLTPLGGVLGLQEDAQHGNPGGMALNAASLIPGSVVGKAIAKATPEAERLAQGIIAYHGSPHSFDKFDLSKIGTGEGAQAYGHGLYFAESEPVAQAYRKALTQSDGLTTLYNVDGKIVPKRWSSDDPESVAANMMHLNDNDRQATLGQVEKIKASGDTTIDWDKVASTVNGIKNPVTIEPNIPGSMYQVRINADPAHFLDWDKPLSEQPHVAQTLGLGTDEKNRLMLPNGERAHPEQLRGERLLKSYYEANSGDVGRASDALNQAGIPGIKYLDAGSRSAGDGSRNYVVFNDQLVDILKKYGLAGLGAGVGASTFMGGAPGMAPQPAQASTDW